MFGGKWGNNSGAPKGFGMYGAPNQPSNQFGNQSTAGVFAGQAYGGQNVPRPTLMTYGAPPQWNIFSHPPPASEIQQGHGLHPHIQANPIVECAPPAGNTFHPHERTHQTTGDTKSGGLITKPCPPQVENPSSPEDRDLGDLLAQLANYSNHYKASESNEASSKTIQNVKTQGWQELLVESVNEKKRESPKEVMVEGTEVDASVNGPKYHFEEENDPFDVTWPAPESSPENGPESSGIQSPDLPGHPAKFQYEKLEEILKTFKFDDATTQKLKETVMSRLAKPTMPSKPMSMSRPAETKPKEEDMLSKLQKFLHPELATEPNPPDKQTTMVAHENSSFIGHPFQLQHHMLSATAPQNVDSCPPVPGTQQQYSSSSVMGEAWDKATREFEKRLQGKNENPKRSRSSDSSTSSSSASDSSYQGKRKKKSSRRESKKSKKKKVSDSKKAKDKSIKQEKKKKNEAPRSIDDDIVKLMGKVEEVKLRKFEFQKRETLLTNEMARMKKQHGELCRKMQRQKDGHKDPLLIENVRLQNEIKKQLKNIRSTIEEMEKTLKETEPRLGALRERRKAKEASRKTGKEKAEKIEKPEVQPVHYELFDGGSHFCRFCAVTCASLYDYFQHLHSSSHMAKTENKGVKSPWTPEHVKDPAKAKKPPSGARVVVEKMKGVEFFLPCVGFYCKLCCEFSGDPVCAEDHLKSEKHIHNYHKHLKENPDYERSQKQEMSSTMQRKTEETALLSVSSVSESSTNSPNLSRFEPNRHVSSAGSHIKISVPSGRSSPDKKIPEREESGPNRKSEERGWRDGFEKHESRKSSHGNQWKNYRSQPNQRIDRSNPNEIPIEIRNPKHKSRPSSRGRTYLPPQNKFQSSHDYRRNDFPSGPSPPTKDKQSRWNPSDPTTQKPAPPVPEIKPDAVNLAKAVKNRLEGKASAAELAMLHKYDQEAKTEKQVPSGEGTSQNPMRYTGKMKLAKRGNFVPTTVARGFVPISQQGSSPKNQTDNPEMSQSVGQRGTDCKSRMEKEKGAGRGKRRSGEGTSTGDQTKEDEELELLASLASEVVKDMNKLKKSGGPSSDKPLFGEEKLPSTKRGKQVFKI